MKKKHIISITSSCIILIGIIAVLYVPSKANSEYSTAQPTVFVHGYKGTSNSFGYLLDRFENKYEWGNKALVYWVSPQGEIRAYNLNKEKIDSPFVQVIFENNRASMEDNAQWLSAVLDHMKKHYYIDSVNLVGHSMGGLVAVKYLESYHGDTQPKVEKLITIGSPFGGVYTEEYFQINRDAGATDLEPDSVALQLLKENKIPSDVDVLGIGSTGDAVAVPESVQSIRTIIPDDQLQVIMIENDKLGHSALHENEEVDKIIHSFLAE